MANSDKYAIGFDLLDLFRFDIADFDSGYAAVVADDFLNSTVPDNINFRIFEEAFLQDFFCAKGVAAMNHGDFRGEVSKKKSFLDSCISTAD